MPPTTGGIFINIENMPIDFVIIRASSIPTLIKAEKSQLKAGITGSDILWEAGMGRDAGEKIPVEKFAPNYQSPMLFIGMTKQFSEYIQQENGRKTLTRDLAGKMIVTKFPRITREVFTEKDVKEVEIFPMPGTTEAIQYIFADCYGILDVISTGRTTAANDIQTIEKFYQVTLRMIESPSISRQEKDILDQLREIIFLAVQRKRMI